QFIATKLVRRFVADDAPATLVDRVAAVFKQTDGDVRAMLRTILTSDEFFSLNAIRAKVKSPFELVTSTLRAVNAEIETSAQSTVVRVGVGIQFVGKDQQEIQLARADAIKTLLEQTLAARAAGVNIAVLSLLQTIEQMGQFLYTVEAPTGYPDRGDFWL